MVFNGKKDENKGYFGQPIGVYLLCITEMFERFTFQGLLVILCVYAYTSLSDGGLGLTYVQSLQMKRIFVTGTYIVYMIGSVVAYGKYGVMLGLFSLLVGNAFLAFKTGIYYFTLGLFFVSVGCAILRPNAIRLIESQYSKNDLVNRNVAFGLLYTMLNLGGVLGMSVTPILAKYYNYKVSLAAGFVGTTLCIFICGLISFLAYQQNDKFVSKIENNTDQHNNYISERIGLCFFILLFILIYRTVEFQASGTMTIFADTKINTELFGIKIPGNWFYNINPMMVTLIAPIFARYSRLQFKAISGCIYGMLFVFSGLTVALVGSIFANKFGKANIWFVIVYYILTTIGEIVSSTAFMATIPVYAPGKYSSLFIGAIGLTFAMSNFITDSLGIIAISTIGFTNLFFIMSFTTLFTAIFGVVMKNKMEAIMIKIDKDNR